MKNKTKIDHLIERAKKGDAILQDTWGEFTTNLVYNFDDFFFETYKHNLNTGESLLYSVECISEEVARFSLTTRY